MRFVKHICVLICVLFSVTVYSQKTIQLTDKRTGKVKVFRIGQTFHYKASEDSDFEKARIQNITSDSIIVLFLPNEDAPDNLVETSLKDIHSIRKLSSLHEGSQVAGSLFILGGAYLMLGSGALTDTYNEPRGKYIGGGALLFAAGTLPFIIKPKTYYLGVTHTATLN